MREGGLEALERLFGSGHYTGSFAQGHEMRLFAGEEIASLFRAEGLRVITTASSNCLSAGNDQEVEALRSDGILWSRFLEWELREGVREGALDAGHHIIAVGVKENEP
jgi:hypothetical protein